MILKGRDTRSYQQGPYASQDTYAQQQLAKGDPYAQPDAYPLPQRPNGAPTYAQRGLKVRNPWANRALYSGIVSLVLSSITLFSLVGFAGLITGTFAIVRGVVALNQSKQLPGNIGRGQVIAAIVMGALAWAFVLLSFALPSASS